LKLVIIAAGEGSRIRPVSNNIPKTLLKIGGQPIIDYLLDNCCQTGLTDCVVVTGYRGEMVKTFLGAVRKDLNTETVHNPDWRLPNGLSVLAARPLIPYGEDFLISMADHLYGPQLLDLIVNSSLTQTIANVGLDFKTDDIFDLEDAMKVTVDPSNPQVVTGMSKQLTSFNAVDCGIFKCRYEFFKALETAKERGKCSLADACNLLIPQRKMGGVDIGNHFWIDIDTPAAFKHGEENRFFTPKV